MCKMAFSERKPHYTSLHPFRAVFVVEEPISAHLHHIRGERLSAPARAGAPAAFSTSRELLYKESINKFIIDFIIINYLV